MKDVLDASSDSIDNMSIDEKAGCIDLPFEPRERGLFNLCLLVGLNYMTGQAYVKSVFPSQVRFCCCILFLCSIVKFEVEKLFFLFF